MSRKDLILLTIVVNVGILVILFINSLKPMSSPQVPHQVSQVTVSAPEKTPLIQESAVVKTHQSPEVKEVSKEIPSEAEDILKPFLAEDLIEVEVKKGDILGKIARRYQVSVEDIVQINNLNGTQLQIGQILYIPKKTVHQRNKVTDAIQHPNQIHDERYYTVKSGDSLWSIAMKNHMKVDDLLKINQMTEQQAKRLKPGDRLKIR